MKQLKQFISEKLHISQYKKQQEITDDDYFIFVIVYGDLYDEFVSDYSDAMIRASSYPDGFIVNVDEVESYINLSELYAYEIPKKYSIDEFEKAYKNDEIDPEEDLEAVDFRVIKKERWKI